MKFSFDAGSYRDNLASEIREKRGEDDREGAKELLNQERNTLRYHIAEDIKNVLRKIEQKKDLTEVNGTPSQENTTEKGKELSREVIMMEGSDGKERQIEVRTFDVSERIPEELRLLFDIERLATLDRKFGELEVGPKKFAFGTDPFFNFEDYVVASYPDAKKMTEERREQIYEATEKAFYDGYDRRFPEKSKAFDSLELKEFNEFIDGLTDIQEHMFAYKLKLQELNDVARDLTDGDYLRGDMFCHVVGALGIEGDLTHLPSERPEDYKKLVRRSPHQKSDADLPEEDVFDVHTAISQDLWFSTTKVWSSSPENIVLICNPKSDRFKNEMEAGHWHSRVDDLIDLYLSGRDKNNLHITFKKEESWVYIADWIVDLYHSRLYQISEVSES